MEWSVLIDIETNADLKDRALDAMMKALTKHSPALSAGQGSVGARMAVEAKDWSDALGLAERAMRKAMRSANLPARGQIVEASTQEWSRFEAELERPNFPELVGVAEVAEILGVSKQRVSNLAQTKNFPKPMYELASGPIWAKPAIERFVEGWNRKPGRPRTVVADGSTAPAVAASRLAADQRTQPHRQGRIAARVQKRGAK